MLTDWLIDVFVGIISTVLGYIDMLIPGNMTFDLSFIQPYFGMASYYIDFAPWLTVLGLWMSTFFLFFIAKLIIWIYKLLPFT